MIRLPDGRIIVTPCKTGSSSLHAHLCPPGQVILGPQSNGYIEKHGIHLPYGNVGPFYVVVRNPYTRAISLYNHWWMPTTWSHFIQCELIKDPWNSSISTMMEEFKHLYSYWQLEHIESCLLDAGLPTGMSRQNVSDIKDIDYYGDINSVQAVRHWARRDFLKFNYSLEVPHECSSMSQK